jgi:hypothetical protein
MTKTLDKEKNFCYTICIEKMFSEKKKTKKGLDKD